MNRAEESGTIMAACRCQDGTGFFAFIFSS